jgi:hypothetical protein
VQGHIPFDLVRTGPILEIDGGLRILLIHIFLSLFDPNVSKRDRRSDKQNKNGYGKFCFQRVLLILPVYFTGSSGGNFHSPFIAALLGP